MKSALALFLVVLAAAVNCAVCADPPVVTIDSNNNFCINGEPTFLIGTMGGDASDWQDYLKPAGFNFRFLGSTATPGAHSAGLWELPDAFEDPSQISTMKTDPGYLMWDLCYEIDVAMDHSTDWVGHTPVDIAQKRQQCMGYDGTPTRPVGVCWGNRDPYEGSEFWGKDGYWLSYRQYAQTADYLIAGDYGWIWEETTSHAVRTTKGPVIALNRCWPTHDYGGDFCPSPENVRLDFWQSVVLGAKGIILDRFEMELGPDYWVTWFNLDAIWWQTIEQAVTEITSISDVILEPGPWTYYKKPSIEIPEAAQIMYTFRPVGGDLYLIACNLWPIDARSADVRVQVVEANATGQVFFDYLSYGAVLMPPTATTITDYTKSWATNELAGHRLWVTKRATGEDLYYPIAGNTNDTITIASGDFLADGVARGDTYKVIELIQLNNREFRLNLEPGGRKVIKFENVTYFYPTSKTAEAVATPSNRKWKLLMDCSDEFLSDQYPVDAYGMCYDSYRGRLVVQGGLKNPWPAGKPNPTDEDVWMTASIWEFDIDTGYYSGQLRDGHQQSGDPWPSSNYYHDLVYDPDRQCAVGFHKSGEVQEWRGIEQGWNIVPPEEPIRTDPGSITHYSACYDQFNHRFLLYGGKEWDHPGTQYRGWQYVYEWRNYLYAFDGANWLNLNNPDANLPVTKLEEPVMCWDSNQGEAVLFGLSHDGKWNTDTDPERYFQSTPQQTYEFTMGTLCGRKYTSHVPYVYANYQMVFDPRTDTTLLFGGLPSVNGRGTDLYEYNGTDWIRADYDDSGLSAQDVRRIPTLTYDSEHQMVLFLDTREGKIWGLTSGLETEAATIEDAKSLPDGTLVSVDGNIVGRNFGSYFYMQDEERLSGIRVVYESGAAVPGKIVNVIGTMGTLATGERQITAQVVGTGSDTELRPLALTTKSLGGTQTATTPGVYEPYGVNNIGIVVTVCGEVTYVGADYVYVDDGSNLSDGSGQVGAKVGLNGVAAPIVGDYVAVTGISGVEEIAGHNARVVLLNQASDMVSM